MNRSTFKELFKNIIAKPLALVNKEIWLYLTMKKCKKRERKQNERKRLKLCHKMEKLEKVLKIESLQYDLHSEGEYFVPGRLQGFVLGVCHNSDNQNFIQRDKPAKIIIEQGMLYYPIFSFVKLSLIISY